MTAISLDLSGGCSPRRSRWVSRRHGRIGRARHGSSGQRLPAPAIDRPLRGAAPFDQVFTTWTTTASGHASSTDYMLMWSPGAGSLPHRYVSG